MPANFSFMATTASSAAGVAGPACAIDKNGGVGQYPRARQIALARQLFTPDGNDFGARAGLRGQLADPAQTLPCLRRIRLVEAPILELQTIFPYPVLSLEFRQAPREFVGDGAQVQNIVRGIHQLLVRERALRPVGAGLALRDGDVEQRLHQLRVADLGFEADAGRGDLRIEHRRHHLFAGQINSLEILARGMDEFTRAGRGQSGHQRVETADAQRIDAPDLTGCAQLQQAQFREKRALPQEFCVHADR